MNKKKPRSTFLLSTFIFMQEQHSHANLCKLARCSNLLFPIISVQCRVMYNIFFAVSLQHYTLFYHLNSFFSRETIKKREADVEYADYDELSYHLPAAPVSVPVLVKKKSKKDEQDLSKIPGIPGVDYPVYHSVPPTSFSCNHVPYLPGMYANVETGCQVRKIVFSFILFLFIGD